MYSSRLKYESGVHRVQRVPVTESSGRIHTSTATVAVLPEAEDVEIEINPADLRIDTYRASGAGGQHVNRTDSAVRITHIPTGLVVTSQDQRSQIQNREQAMRVLKSRLYDMQRQKQQSEYCSSRRRGQIGTGDRSERIRTYNFPQGRVTDHRIGLTLYKINDIMAGDLDEIIDALTLAEQTAMLSKRTIKKVRQLKTQVLKPDAAAMALAVRLLNGRQAGRHARPRRYTASPPTRSNRGRRARHIHRQGTSGRQPADSCTLRHTAQLYAADCRRALPRRQGADGCVLAGTDDADLSQIRSRAPAHAPAG